MPKLGGNVKEKGRTFNSMKNCLFHFQMGLMAGHNKSSGHSLRNNRLDIFMYTKGLVGLGQLGRR